jgi:hypothetical protein
MTKKISLTAALSDQTSEAPETPPPAAPPAAGPISAARPGRAAKTNITGYFDHPVKWELQELATERSRTLKRKVTTQELLAEALNDLFKKYGRPELAS